MRNWICRKCEHLVLAESKPQPIHWNDGHVCYFVEEKLPEEIESPVESPHFDEIDQVQRLVKELEDAGCKVGWSDLEGLAMEALCDGGMDRYYVMARFETNYDMASLIMAVLDNFRPE